MTQLTADLSGTLAEPTALGDSEEVAVGNSSLLPDPRYFWMIFRRRIWIFLTVVVAIMAAVTAYATLTPKRYTATSAVLIEPRRGDPIQPRETAAAEQAPSSDYIDTQIVVLDSPQLAAAVVTALNLTDDDQFGGGDVGELTPAQRQARLVASAQALSKATTIRRAGQTSIIEIDVTTLSPTQSARIANEFVNQYLLSLAQTKQAADQRASAQIDSKLGELRVDAEHADAALQRYKIANGLMSAEGATMAEQETSSLNQQIATARAALAERQGRLAAARRQLAKGGGQPQKLAPARPHQLVDLSPTTVNCLKFALIYLDCDS